VTHSNLTSELLAGAHEHAGHALKSLYYALERRVGHLLLRRAPPRAGDERLLNLGCGPLKYQGWINADEYALKRLLRQRDFRPDWRLDVSRPWKCPDDFWDGIFTQHVIEHLSYSAAARALRECFRTLKPGAWIRVSVPNLRAYVDYYEGRGPAPCGFEPPARVLALSYLSQMHGHASLWDAELLKAMLDGLGFVACRETGFGQGSDPRLVKDQPEKQAESLYVEARKPAAATR
jgi:predicted SAM-dependent methyltransferase